jgi:hypothetical protein
VWRNTINVHKVVSSEAFLRAERYVHARIVLQQLFLFGSRFECGTTVYTFHNSIPFCKFVIYTSKEYISKHKRNTYMIKENQSP